MRKRFVYVLAVIFLAVLAVRIAFLATKRTGGDRQGIQRPPVAVETDSVRFGPIQEIRQFTGSVYPQYQYVIAPKVSGRIIEIRKRIGDQIQRDEVIARVDDAEYQQAVREAEANLKIAHASLTEARSQLSLARQELERVESLQQKGIASPAELDAATANFDAQQSRLKLAQAQVEQREASLKSAKIRLDYTVLAAPEPGFTGERFVDEGSLLAPNDPVISVIGIDKVIIRTTIIEKDYGLIHTGQHAEVEVDAFPSKGFEGQVARIAPLLQLTSRMAQMEIEVLNDSLILKPGMFARVNVLIEERDTTQIVPSKAVINRDGQRGIFLIDLENTTARYVPVRVGIVTPDETEILTPEIEGLVVTLGQHLLTEGSPVILPQSPGETRTGKPGEYDRESD